MAVQGNEVPLSEQDDRLAVGKAGKERSRSGVCQYEPGRSHRLGHIGRRGGLCCRAVKDWHVNTGR